MSSELSEPEVLRRHSLNELYKAGIEPYPAALFKVSHHATEVFELFDRDPESDSLKNIALAGRIMSVRDMGKAAFVVLQDSTGKIQLYVKRDEICPGDDKSLYDRGGTNSDVLYDSWPTTKCISDTRLSPTIRAGDGFQDPLA